MAFIFQKITGNSPEQCLVLESREAFVYPFDVGTWRELRVSAFISLTSGVGLNTVPADEDVPIGSNYKQGIFFGLKDSGSVFPQRSGAVFAGWGSSNGESSDNRVGATNSQIYSHNSFGTQCITTIDVNGTRTYSQLNGQTINAYGPSTPTGDTLYCGLYSQRYLLNQNSGKNIIHISHYRNVSVNNSDYSTFELRRSVSNLSTSDYSTLLSGYLTEAVSITGENVSIPNALFIYIPFVRSRLRIHNLVIEKIN